MLEFYLSTVIVWTIIIYSILVIFKDGIRKKINTDETKKKSIVSRLGTLFVISAVPILRLFVAIAFIYIATCSQEDWDELMSKAKSRE